MLADVPRLSTARLELRPMGPQDVGALVAGVGNYDVTRWLSQVPYPYSAADAEDFLSGRVAGSGLHWGIDAGDGLIGVISIDDELGYWLARPAWGMGYGFEAARAVVDHWFFELEQEELVSGYLAGNDRSARVLTCLGFREQTVELRPSRALSQDVACHIVRLDRDGWEARRRFDVTTERLRLRELERADAHALVELATPPVARMVSSIPETLTLAAAKAFINKRRWQGWPGFLLGIEGPDGDLIGCIGCGGAPVTAMIFFGEAYWGRGYATEAAAAFVAELFDRFPLSEVRAEHFIDNPASGDVLRKLGFERIGTHTGTSEARVEPAPVVEYRLTRDAHRKPK
ncbi:MAG: GNAT family N-acetyltransferase [Paracoccaceae bacterium]|nr:GNAT family N-acetyltransferase [Paracoccaceae bacterium]